MQLLQIILFPFSVCYGMITWLRNLLFDIRILRSERFDLPVIGVGNLSTGGTGKTPQIEYLIRLLSPGSFLATLSRGYGRKSEGFIIGSKRSQAKFIGDEPLQYAKKFPEVKVAVDEKRRRGIRLLLQKYPNLDIILLDDAFQHRYVKPGFNILLTSYHNLYTEDFLLPSGRLREPRSGADRADVIIVTKTPKIFSPITRRRIVEDIAPHADQSVFFTCIKYDAPVPVYESSGAGYPAVVSKILLFTGIANDYPLREHLQRMCSELVAIKFPDHHPYNPKDLDKIIKAYHDMPTQKKVIITTEKDAMRLKIPELSTILKGLPLFYIPIEIGFQGSDKEKFNNLILQYVEKSKRNR
jgi:tetraacyldisaccharide 4'-kinase